MKGGFEGARRNDPKILKFGAKRNLGFSIVGVFLDLNFQTTITDEFAPAIREKLKGIWQQNMRRHHSTNGLYKKDVK